MTRFRSNYEEQFSPRFQWLSESQLEELHSATIEVLERVGTRVDHSEALQLLKEAGCIVEGIRVNLLRLITIWPFPDEQVREALRKTGTAVVVEMNQGQLWGEVNRVNDAGTKIYPVNGIDGELITPEFVMAGIKEAVK